jgi:hypothetical protein
VTDRELILGPKVVLGIFDLSTAIIDQQSEGRQETKPTNPSFKKNNNNKLESVP